MLTIYEYLREFWLFWFPATFANESIIDVLSLISTIAVIWFALLRPLVRISKNLTDRR